VSYDLEIIREKGFIRARISGVETLQNVLSAWREVAGACNTHKCSRVLCEGSLRGPGPVVDIYEFGRKFLAIGMPPGTRIALVSDEENYRKMKFAETVVSTRAAVVPRVFLNVDEAVAWLRE